MLLKSVLYFSKPETPDSLLNGRVRSEPIGHVHPQILQILQKSLDDMLHHVAEVVVERNCGHDIRLGEGAGEVAEVAGIVCAGM